MNAFRFSASLRVFTKTVDPDEICERIALKLTLKQKIGDQRKTPKGGHLDGVYASSYCLFRLERQEKEKLHEMLDRVCDDLGGSRDLFKKIRNTGGRAELFVGWYSSGNTGDTFSSQLLRKLCELELDLGLDVYDSEGDAET